ncbi:hypothetical protein EZS27_001498 [termite gut metagenome]|uniref:Uncharacterized protein n=1 Tax=termite gut metagenome TaxID=433724 RepID=A0A5J4T0G7_9ZZZZ
MKKEILYIIFSLILFNSCDRETFEENENLQKLEININNNLADTRLELTQGTFNWETNDTINIICDDSFFTLDNREEVKNFDIVKISVKDEWKINEYNDLYWTNKKSATYQFIAIYPKKEVIIDKTLKTIKASLPNNQVQLNDSVYKNQYDLLFSFNEIKRLEKLSINFNSVFSLLELKIKGNDSIKNIRFESDQSIAYDNIDFVIKDNKINEIKYNDEGYKYIDLNLEKPVQLNSKEYKSFYIILTGSIYWKGTIILNYGETNKKNLAVLKSKNFEANKKYILELNTKSFIDDIGFQEELIN